MKTTTLHIPSMKSAHCQMAVKFTVEKIDGTQEIKTETGVAEIAYNPATTSITTIIEAIENGRLSGG
jgi:copper chaperone CopZ